MRKKYALAKCVAFRLFSCVFVIFQLTCQKTAQTWSHNELFSAKQSATFAKGFKFWCQLLWELKSIAKRPQLNQEGIQGRGGTDNWQQTQQTTMQCSCRRCLEQAKKTESRFYKLTATTSTWSMEEMLTSTVFGVDATLSRLAEYSRQAAD